MIKINMEMPRNCAECPFYSGSRYGGDCAAAYNELYFAGALVSFDRHEHCPLEEVDEDD